MASSNVDCKPNLEMRFDNMDDASKFWLAYSLCVGFRVRVRFTNKKEDGSESSCRLIFCKEILKRKEKR
ncbi:hypothetical protein MTR_4g069880 [Medicago truncatula]|uniref:FAR1 domain-containing protein n=1 Tax=Medicago truncatula TaxID=3880 RepID=G7JG48_MEDTR|nr:hypothetical protein MTR_4g069880 [Medicago truncatula]